MSLFSVYLEQILFLIQKGVYDDKYVSTIGVDFETKKIYVLGKSIKLYLVKKNDDL